MTEAQALQWTIGACLVAYTLTAGADFGGGVWDLLALGRDKVAQRALVERAIAPIWEANHIWMIVVVVLLFAGFPEAFAVISIALHIPITLALIGIVLRGAAFTFRAYGLRTADTRESWGRLFAWSSLLTPVLLGMILAGLSSGDIRTEAGVVRSGFLAGWATGFGLLVGAFCMSLFALLGAVYLSTEASQARSRSSQGLALSFRKRALISEAVCGGLAAAVAWRARTAAPELFDNLLRSPWSVLVQFTTAAAALTTVVALALRRFRLARAAVIAQVAQVVVAWGVAMDGYLVMGSVHSSNAGLRVELAQALLVTLGVGALALGPALWWLMKVFKTPN